MFGFRGVGQSPDGIPRRHRAGIAWLAADSHEAVLCDGARRPAVSNLVLEPVSGLFMLDVVAIQQSEEHVDVEQGAHVRLAGTV